MLDAKHNFARPVPGGREVASWTSWVSVKPRSKPAGDTTCKTDTRVWPHRKSNKLQWADVFCKLHTNYASSTHTSCMAPRRGYDPWPLVHRLRLRMPHELPEPPVADPKWVAAQLPQGEPAESLQLYPSTPASRMRRAPWQKHKQSVTTYFDNKHWALVGTSCMYDIIVTVLSAVTALRSCNVNPHVCAETQLTHVLICEVLRTHLFVVVKSYKTSLILILRRQRVDSQHVVTHHVSNASLCKDMFSEGHVISHTWHLPMTPTQQSPTESIDQHTVDMSDWHSNETNTHKQVLKARASPMGWHRAALFYQSHQRIVLILAATQSTTTHAASEFSIACGHEEAKHHAQRMLILTATQSTTTHAASEASITCGHE